MKRRTFTKFVIGVSLAIMTGAYNIENPIQEKVNHTGHVKGKDLVFYINDKPIAKVVSCEIPISGEVKRMKLNDDVVAAR